MRQKQPKYTLIEFCKLFGSRQAYYLAHHKARRTTIAHSVVLKLVSKFRSSIPMHRLLHFVFFTLDISLIAHKRKLGMRIQYYHSINLGKHFFVDFLSLAKNNITTAFNAFNNRYRKASSDEKR